MMPLHHGNPMFSRGPCSRRGVVRYPSRTVNESTLVLVATELKGGDGPRAGVDRRTVLRALKSLEHDRKMLKVLRRGGLNRGPSTYRVFPYAMERGS
jgi:hypothetical protein